MATITYYNLQEFCRICLSQLQQVSSGNSYNLHSKPELASLLKLFVSLDVLKQPSKFPNSICEQCYKKVISYEEFRNVAHQNEETLQQVVRKAVAEDNDNNEALNTSTESKEDDEMLVPELLAAKLEPMVKIETVDGDFNLNNTDASVNNHISRSPLSIKEEPVDQDMDVDSYELCSEDDSELNNVPNNVGDIDEETFNYLSNALGAENSRIGNLPITIAARPKKAGYRRALECNHCGKQSYKLVYLEAHIRAVHEGYEKPFLCQRCGKSFTRYSQLHEHMRSSHPAELKEEALRAEIELTCQLCQRKYSSKRTLDQHLKRHAQIKEHVCTTCGVAKVTRTELMIHLRTHEPNVEKFKCTMCPQLFNHKNAISRHIRVVHEGERRFKCGHCNKRFGTRNAQERHEILHTDERPFECEVCQKKYTHMDRLTVHMRSHDKSCWRFQCRFCTKRCISRQNLIAHEQRHNGTKPHICNICSKGFVKVEDLNVHKQIHDENDDQS